MIVLRALEVERFRRHERLARIDFDERFTVVRGANEAGKSTMLQALHYAFFRRSGATGQDIDALATWGTSGLRPCVNVEFAYDREEYRLEKSWGGGGSTQLYKRDGSGRFMPFQTDGADDFVNALFCGEPHGKGFFPGFRAAHLGIGHLLFATQGRLTIADDDRDALNSLTQSELSRIVGSGTKSPAEIGLSRKIGRAYKDLFKDNRGLTVRAESPKLEREIADIDRRLVEAEDEIRAYDAVARDRREKRAELDTLVVACAAAELAVATEAPRLQAAALAKAEVERCEMLLATAKSAYDALVARKRTIATHRETIAALEPDLHRSQTQSIEAHEALARAEAAARAMRSEANAVAARGDGLAVLRADAHEAERLTEAARERERLGQLREELAEIDGALGSEERRLATADAPSDDVLSSLRAAIDDECRLRGQIEAADIKVRFLAETAQWLHVEDGGRTSERGVAPGEAVEYRNDGALAIVIEHVGRLDVCGPVADLTGLHECLARARGVVAACESRFGSADPYELRERQQAGAQAKQSVRELRRKRAKLLGERTIAEIDARIHALDASATDSVPDLDGLRAALQRAEKANDENQKRARENLSRAADVLAAANARAASASTTLAELEQRVQKPTNFLQQIAPADVSDADREREIEGAFGALDMAKREAARAAEAYAPYRDIVDPASAFATKQRRALELAALVNEVTAEDARLEGRLRSAAERGLSTRRTELAESRALVEEKLDRARADEAAIALLKEIADDVERERTVSFAEPILARVAPWYARLCGRDLTRLHLGSHHGMSGIGLPDVPRPIGWNELSGGAADQLAILVRLAFASMLAADERIGRMPVIFDDPLVNCDDVRRPKMLEIINEASEHAQIIVFTCHASGYVGSGAKTSSIVAQVRPLAS